MTRLPRLWPMLALLTLAFNLRPVAGSVGPVLTEIAADIGLNGFTAGLLTSMPTLCFAAFGALAPWLSQRLGAHLAIAIALAALVAGQTGRLLVDSAWPFLGFSAVALGGMAIANVLLPSLVREHYPHRLGLATALYCLSMSIGITLASSATAPLALALGGWRAALGTGIVAAAAALMCWVPLLRGRTRHRHMQRRAVTLRQVASTPLGWAMAVLFGIQSAQAYSVFGWLPSVYRSAGMGEVEAGLMLGIATGVGIVPAFVVPAYVARTKDPSWVLLVNIGFLAAGFTGLMLSPLTLPWVWACCLALGTASFPLILALFGTRSRTPAGTAALSGFAQSIGYGLAVLGPLSFGMAHAWTATWYTSITLQLVLCLPMAAAGLYACRPRAIEDQLPRG